MLISSRTLRHVLYRAYEILGMCSLTTAATNGVITWPVMNRMRLQRQTDILCLSGAVLMFPTFLRIILDVYRILHSEP